MRGEQTFLLPENGGIDSGNHLFRSQVGTSRDKVEVESGSDFGNDRELFACPLSLLKLRLKLKLILLYLF